MFEKDRQAVSCLRSIDSHCLDLGSVKVKQSRSVLLLETLYRVGTVLGSVYEVRSNSGRQWSRLFGLELWSLHPGVAIFTMVDGA